MLLNLRSHTAWPWSVQGSPEFIFYLWILLQVCWRLWARRPPATAPTPPTSRRTRSRGWPAATARLPPATPLAATPPARPPRCSWPVTGSAPDPIRFWKGAASGPCRLCPTLWAGLTRPLAWRRGWGRGEEPHQPRKARWRPREQNSHLDSVSVQFI